MQSSGVSACSGLQEHDGGSSGEEEEEEGGQPRYSRRNRQTVQRYSPRREERPSRSGRDRERRDRQRGYDSEGFSDEEQVGRPWDVLACLVFVAPSVDILFVCVSACSLTMSNLMRPSGWGRRIIGVGMVNGVARPAQLH